MNAGILANLLKIPKSEAEDLIEYADLDGDGFLDSYDFICLVGLFTKAELEEKLESVFALFDDDFSQVIQDKELERLVECVVSVNENTTRPNSFQVKKKL